MPLLTDLNRYQILKYEKSKKKRNKTLRRKNTLRRKEKVRRKNTLRRDRNQRTRIERAFLDTDIDIKKKLQDQKRMDMLEKKEKELEEDALKNNPDDPIGIVSNLAGKATDFFSDLTGMNTTPKPLTAKGISNEIKGSLNNMAKPDDSPGFFTSVGRKVVKSYTDTGKGLVNSVLGTAETASNVLNNAKLKQCDANFVNNFDTFFLSCDRPDLIKIYNTTVFGLQKNSNHFPEDTRTQISLLRPIENKEEKKPSKFKEPIQTGGKLLKKNKLFKKKFISKNKKTF